ncbi:hypothetical protein HGG82_00315 [Marinomonas sp. M1K-6]|uniref:DUF4139 domain-containing protein n=1 Tax=Marinomonas profundi TaxID=2726122 RepID=A0A847R1N1_9GAMM|nr:hypothetical protein [Marinomonas profundi]NLQ16063.1 hypothetical protein [Marinomonas profundi]UDV03349.1 hypothetical protein J8N69_00685 [Marinomonas profundi]
MKKQSTYLSLGLLLSAITPALNAAPPTALASSIHAVIGLDSSQVVEDSQQLSLTPTPSTLFPLQENFAPITHLENHFDKNWFDEIGRKVTVEHKHRKLNYTGLLTKIEPNNRSFLLMINDRPTTLPLDDFYLIPLEKADINKTLKPAYQVTYQTDQLAWTPQLSLIFENDQVSVSQQALLHNHSSSTIKIQDSLLHYARNATPRLFKAERSTLAMSADQSSIDYQDNEISYPIGHDTLTIAPYSNTLIPLPSSASKISKLTHTAQVYTQSNHAGEADLNFYANLRFVLQDDGLPGTYKTFWKRENLLIPGNTAQLNTVRKDHTVNITTNKSQDITGYLTLVSVSSQKLPSTQVWRATIENHADKAQNYAITQNTNGIIEVLEGNGVTKTNANSLLIEGKIEAHSKQTITYKVALKN